MLQRVHSRIGPLCSSPFLHIIVVWASGEIGSSEIALMEFADLILLECTDNGVGDATVVE
jgi:hypothetical protein